MSISNIIKRIKDEMRNDAGVNGDAQIIEQIVWILFLKVYDAKEEEWELTQQNFPQDLRGSETADLFLSVIMYRLKKNGRAAVVLPDGFLFGTDQTKVAIKKKLLTEFNLDLCGYPHFEEVILPPDELIANYRKRRAEIDTEIDDVLEKIEELLAERGADAN
ncbi:MAG: N-6 DNA methylase [Candidatus Ancillula sp.]|jgi:type I restriction-modification system DNA methylase subunit|nr:N-6 DNA methylase [Candidatus Ancillula sp.]